MKSKISSFLCDLLLIPLLSIMPGFTGIVFGQDKQMETPEFANQRIEKLRHAAQSLMELAKQPIPANLPAAEQKVANRYSLWLKNSSQKLYALANRWQAALDKAVRENANDLKIRRSTMKEMNMSFNLQYLMLQNKISQENRQFELVTNIMRNKHDTAENSINTLR